MEQQPHDNWAEYYDFVYEKSFGYFYQNLTIKTINTIKDILQSGTIIDYGAGTGRLSIPLKEQGYEIIAVEKSKGMVSELEKKNLDIQIYNCGILDYKNGKCNLALALFTVLSYSITEDELKKNFQNIFNHLNHNGHFFFDLPNSRFFNNGQIMDIKSDDFNRSVSLIKNGNDNGIYIYHEKCNGIYNGEKFNYEDEFPIRYWNINFIDKLLREIGFIETQKDFSQFNGTGSTYKLYKKI